MRLRPALKTAGAWALHATGVDRAIGRARGVADQPLVLCYHRVVHDPHRHSSSAPAMLVSQRTLAAQLDWVSRRYRIVPLDELAASIEAGRLGRRPLAAVTFDDGYADVYRNAMPVLERKGIPAAVFVCTELVGTSGLLVHDRLHVLLVEANRRFGASGIVSLCDRHHVDRPCWRADGAWPPLRVTRLAELLLATVPRAVLDRMVEDLGRYVSVPPEVHDKLRLLDWSMLREMRRRGVTVGSHTRTHRVLPNESAEDVLDELAGSKRTLEAKLAEPVRHVSFPNGHFTPATLQAVRAAGYRWAYTTCGHRMAEESGLIIPRRTFWERSIAGWRSSVSTAVASCQVRGVFDHAGRCPHDHRQPSPRLATTRVQSVRP